MQIQFSYESTEVLTKLEITLKLSVLFNPTSHGVSDSVASMGRGPQRPPKKSREESFLTPCCYIAFFN